MLTPIQNFLKQEAAGGILLFIFATLAIILANTPLSYLYFDFFANTSECPNWCIHHQ